MFSSSSILQVITCWEHSKQCQGFDEKIGIDIMLALFEINPQAKNYFGFRPDQVVDANNGLQRIGILIHGQRFMQTLDCFFSFLGPDEDTIEELFLDFNKDSCQEGMSLHQFAPLLEIVVKVMAGVIGENWTEDLQLSWMDVIGYLQVVLGKIAAEQLSQVSIPQHYQGKAVNA